MNENCLTNKSKIVVGKISVMMIVLILIQTTIYGFTGEASNLINSELQSVNLTAMVDNSNDVGPMLDKLGIKTKVNEEELEEKYPSVNISSNPENGNATLKFYNPKDQNYRLDIYDLNKGLVASFVNINSDQIEIEREMFNAGAYIYKLVGENSTIYCGTFMLR